MSLNNKMECPSGAGGAFTYYFNLVLHKCQIFAILEDAQGTPADRMPAEVQAGESGQQMKKKALRYETEFKRFNRRIVGEKNLTI